MPGQRQKISMDRDWFFYKGDIQIPYVVKAGGAGSVTDCGQAEHIYGLKGEE